MKGKNNNSHPYQTRERIHSDTSCKILWTRPRSCTVDEGEEERFRGRGWWISLGIGFSAPANQPKTATISSPKKSPPLWDGGNTWPLAGVRIRNGVQSAVRVLPWGEVNRDPRIGQTSQATSAELIDTYQRQPSLLLTILFYRKKLFCDLIILILITSNLY